MDAAPKTVQQMGCSSVSYGEKFSGKPFLDLTKKRRDALIEKFEHDVSDHMPIWIRLPKPR